jgi:hypothetical protein
MKTLPRSIHSLLKPWVVAGLFLPLPCRADVDTEDDGGWAKEFRLGAMTTLNLTARFSTHGNFGTTSGSPGPTGISRANHIYDDGFVRVDGTGNTGGVTSLWGYTGAGQYNSAKQTLTYHATSSYSATGDSKVDGALNPGFDMAYGGKLAQWERLSLSWEMGFQWQNLSFTDDHPLTAVAQRTVHQFSTGGVVIPQAPYSGPASGLGPVIGDVATALPTETGLSGTVSGTRKVEGSLYLLRFGPKLNFNLFPRVGLGVGAGGAVGYLDGKYDYNERLMFADGSQSSSSGSHGSSDVVFGGYVGATLHFFVQKDADIYLGAQFMSLGHQDFGANGREARVDMSQGLQVMAGVHWPF